MPALFVHKLSCVGRDYDNLPDVHANIFLACSSKQQSDSSADFEPIGDNIVIDPCKHNPLECTYSKRLCRIHGVRFLSCVCLAIPVEKLDLVCDNRVDDVRLLS